MERRQKDKELIHYDNGISCFLEAGYIFLIKESGVIRTVLGSCVSVCLWDKRLRYGAMNHYLYPWITEPEKATPQYGNVATSKLVDMMIEAGSNRTDIIAQIYGGAVKEKSEKPDLGTQNVETARKVLKKKDIAIISEDVGGMMGRKIAFDIKTGQVAVLKVHEYNIRDTDWIQYKR